MLFRTAVLAPLLAALAGCPSEDDPPDPDELLGDLVRLDDASDEVLAVIADEVQREGTTINDAAAQLNAPADGAVLPAGTAATVEWQYAPTTGGAGAPWFHGIDTGTFVWIRIDGPGLEEPIDIEALETESYTLSPTRWGTLTLAGGPFTATIITTVVDRGVIVDGPWAPATNGDAEFSIE
jgi:hypothetical protein